jgi:hypothetical protein
LSQAELINETAYDSPTATLSCGPMLADGVVTDTTNNSMNVRRHVQVPIRTAVRNIVVAIPGSFFNPEENPIPTPLTIAAATIEYPAGVFYKLYVGGSASLTVVPGATMARFDPLAITIPAGAEFWVKLFIQWTPGSIKLQNNTQWEIIGNWTNRGIGLTDQTRSTTVLASSPATSLFGNLVVFAICTTAQPCVAFMGDSIMVSGYDQGDPRTGAITLGKALREQIPFTNVSIGGDSCLAYLRGHACRDMFMYDPVKNYPLITHIVITLGVNEIGAGAVELQKNITTVTSIWRNRGVQVIGWTVTPQTSSTDIWATRTGQTVSNVVVEAQRIQYNAWLRTNYASIGMMRIIDAAHIVDPTDSGLWNVDGNAGWWGLLVPIMSGRTISSVNRANYNGNTADGRDYPASQTKSCMIYPMPGDTGTGGGAVSVTFSAGGQLPATATVTAGGDYDYPPMIVIPSSWVGDGLHANGRAFQEIIYRSGISPDWFTL